MKQIASAFLALGLAGMFVPGSLSEFRRTSNELDAIENRHQPVTQSSQQKQKGPIRVQTDLVNILANVLNANNEPVIGLDQGAFDLSEEGVPQKIVRFEPQTNRPLDLALMVDMSGSAAIELKIEKDAAVHFFGEVVRPGDKLAVFSFTSEVTQLSNYTDNVKLLDDSIRRAEPGADMGTSLYDALVLSSGTLKRQGSDRRRAIVLITDAGETTSYYKFDDARRDAISSGALLYTIVVRPMKSNAGWNTAGEHAIQTITDSTGGAMFYPTTVDEIAQNFDLINRELRTQYLLAYYPTPTPPPGSLRHVVVKVNTGDTVRYRKQYFTATQ
ncbi:MAG: VWA domain-containing protein [Candidatus Acidiferrales bacterium]